MFSSALRFWRFINWLYFLCIIELIDILWGLEYKEKSLEDWMVGKPILESTFATHHLTEKGSPFLSVCAHRVPGSVSSVPSLCLRGFCLLDYVTHFLRNLEWFPCLSHTYYWSWDLHVSGNSDLLQTLCPFWGLCSCSQLDYGWTFCLWSIWNVPFNTFPRQLYYSQFRKSFPRWLALALAL